MSRNRLVGLIAAAVVLIAVIVGGIYAYQRKAAPPAPGEPAPVAEQKQQPGARAPAPAPAPQPEAKKTEAPKPTTVPSFDVVRIEQSGEGVIAGRAEAGWTVKLESGGTKVAETIVDEEGAWMVVLEKALPAGSHTLTLRAVSPDGTKALTAQQGVQVAVGPAPSEPQMAGKETAPESGEAFPGAPPPAEPPAAEKAPDVAAKEPEIAPEAVPAPPIPPSERPKPPVRIKKVDYVDVGSDSGKITMSGIGDPGGTLVFFFDDAPVGETVIGSDGTWSHEVEKRLVGDGDHILRVDKINPDSPMPAGRASVTLRRAPEAAAKQEPAPSASAPEAPAPPAASAPAADQPKPEPASKGETAETASPEGTPAPVAGAPVDLSRQPQPVYPSADSEGADTNRVGPDIADAPEAAEKTQIAPAESAKAERDAPVLPLQPVYPSGSPPTSERPSFPVMTGKPVDLSSQPQPLYPGRTADGASQVSAADDPAASSPEVPVEKPSTPAAPPPSVATPPATGSAPAAESSVEKTTSESSPKQAASAESPSLESQPQPVVPKAEPAPQVAVSEHAPSDPAVSVEEPSASPTPPPVAAPAPSGATANAEPPNLGSQPQPVVPKDEPAPQVAASKPAAPDRAVTVEEPAASLTPPPSVAAPSPSTATRGAEPPSVASQPRPVVPKEQPQPEAKPEPSAPIAAAEPPAAPAPSEPASPPASEQTTERAKTPEVAAAPPTVTAETPATKKPEAQLPKVVFNSVDYAEAEGETGSVALTGSGEPGARIHLFLNNHPLGETTVAEDGSWSFETSRKLHPGQHNIRADQLEAGGTVVASASIGMERMEPQPPEEPVAAQQLPAAPPPATSSPAVKETETAAAEADQPEAEESKPRRVRSRNYTVQKGDTLWDIAEDFYGGGWRFRAIVRGNRNKIRNPHWIYPDQQFRMPDKP